MVHNGVRDGRQRYKCKDCNRRFTGGVHRDKSQVITDYIEGKQTLSVTNIRKNRFSGCIAMVILKEKPAPLNFTA